MTPPLPPQSPPPPAPRASRFVLAFLLKLQRHFEGVLLLHDEKYKVFFLFSFLAEGPETAQFQRTEMCHRLTDLNWFIMTDAVQQQPP